MKGCRIVKSLKQYILVVEMVQYFQFIYHHVLDATLNESVQDEKTSPKFYWQINFKSYCYKIQSCWDSRHSSLGLGMSPASDPCHLPLAQFEGFRNSVQLPRIFANRQLKNELVKSIIEINRYKKTIRLPVMGTMLRLKVITSMHHHYNGRK